VGLALLTGAVALVVVVLFGGDSGHSYKLLFENGGQLVKGNEVLVGGQAVGTIDDLSLTGDGQAQIDITVDEPLHEGTTAVVRSTSLSGVANRYVSLTPGPNSGDELPEDSTVAAVSTTAPVDLDQLFNALDDQARANLQKVIQGSATLYAGNTEGARSTYKYFGPALQSGQHLFEELTRDEHTFAQFLVDGADVLGAIAERRDDLSALTENANTALGAIASENASLDRTLAALPPFMRQADTTFLNIRAALDDLDPLVKTSKRATRDLPAFLRDLRPVAERAIPVLRDLRVTVNTPGEDNGLTDVLQLAPQVEDAGAQASETTIRALNKTQDEVELARPYSPDLMAFLTKFGEVAGYYDAHGHYLRGLPVGTGAFSYNPGTSELDPIYTQPDEQFDFFTEDDAAPDGNFTYAGPGQAFDPMGFLRCPGAASQQAQDGSTPFLDDGELTGECDPDDMVIPVTAP